MMNDNKGSAKEKEQSAEEATQVKQGQGQEKEEEKNRNEASAEAGEGSEKTAEESGVRSDGDDGPRNKKEEKRLKKENAELTEKNRKLDKESKELSDKYLRLVAEYDNFRKRSQKEREATYADAYSDALTSILPVVDNLERALKFSEGDKVVEGVKLTMSQLSAALEKMGVKEIECKKFDPTLHNAVAHVEDEAYGENEIIDVFQKGYIKGDKVIRFAMVRVAN